MKKIIFSLLLLTATLSSAFAQHEFDKWILGNGAGLDFTAGANPTVFSSTINAWDNAASISDANGTLLFYSEGSSIHDKNGAVMPNGFGILSDTSGGQPATIVRKPGNENLYYVFTVPNFGGPNGLRYTVVDMTLNGGLGDVDTAHKNVLFFTPAAEKLVTIKHANGYDIWVVSHEWGTNTYRSYLLTANGFVTNHVSSTIGSLHSGNTNNAVGQLTASKAGNRIAAAIFQDGKIDILDFNRQSGVLTNAKTITGNQYVLGVEFSPDGNKLYATNYLSRNLKQFDLSNYTQAAIAASVTTVGYIPQGWAYYGGYMTLGPDDKIYVAQSFSNKIGRINNPNTLGLGCSYDSLAVNLGARSIDAGLVDKITVTPVNYTVQVEIGNAQTICSNSHIIFDPSITGGVPPFTYSWTATGDALSCANCKNPSVTTTQNSSYVLVVTDVNNKTATDTVDYTLSGTTSTLQLSLASNAIDCSHPVDSLYADVTNGTEPIVYHWGDGSNNQTGTASELHMYTEAGIHVISVTDSLGCINSAFDTVVDAGIHVALQQAIQPYCVGDTTGTVTLAVSGGTSPYTYHWTNGFTTSSLDSVSAGSYSVTVTDVTLCSTVFDYNLSAVNDISAFYVFLTPHAANCGNTGSVLANVQSGVPPYKFLWSNNDTLQNQYNLPGGNYSVVVSDSSGCKRRGHAVVESYCASLITGTLFVDTNQNCTHEAGESVLRWVFVTATGNGGSYYGVSNSAGDYTITVPDTGTYHLTASIWSSTACSNFGLCNNASGNVTIANLGDSSLNNNFVASISSGFDLAVHPGWTSSNPGFDKEYWVLPYNESFVPYAGQATVTLVYDTNLIYQYSMAPLPVHDPIAHSLTWTMDSLPLGMWDWYHVRLRSFFHVPVTLSLGQHLNTDVYITPTVGDCDSSNNSLHSSEIVTGSLDPNEKDVEPANRIAQEDSVLRYTIHFQNCGTDSTHFVIVKDTLSNLLDPATVRTVASSHPYSEFNVSGAGILTWVFNPLRLVDSITDPRGSQGFVSFTIQKKKSLAIGTVLSNTASIYFDYNVPVQTNTVTDTVSLNPTTHVSNLSVDNKNQLLIFPNPTNDVVNIQYSNANLYDVAVYDLLGRMVAEKKGKRNQTTLNLNGMARGTYLVKIIDKTDNSTITKRVVLQ